MSTKIVKEKIFKKTKQGVDIWGVRDYNNTCS